MRKGHLYYAAIIAGAFVALTLAGCETADNDNPKPEAYVELGAYKGLEYTIPSGEVTQAEIDDELLYLASNFPVKNTVTNGVVELGDIVNIDYEGTLNGKAFDGGSAKGIDVQTEADEELGIRYDSGFEFEEHLIGAIIGNTINFDVVLPEDYDRDELAGKKVEFSVMINSVQRDGIPEVNDDFIAEISEGQYKTLDEYTVALKEQMEKENLELEESLVYTKLLDMATENAVLKKDLPSAYVEKKHRRLLENSMSMAGQYGVDFATFLNRYMNMSEEEYYAQADEYALKAAKQSLVVQLIAKAEGITVSDDELNAAADVYVEQYKYESRDAFLQETDMDDFREYILISKIQDMLYENAVIKYEDAGKN